MLCRSSNRLIYPWKILTVENSGSTVSQFYEDVVLNDLQNVEPGSLELSAAFLGKSKVSMDAIALSVPIGMAIQSFGAFLWYNVNEIPVALPQPRNAFEVLMSSQRQLARTLPQRKHPRNKKDELYNDLLTLLEEKGLYFLSSDGESAGHNLVRVLTDLLWLIDGHHGTLKDQSCPVPLVFSSFTGYNAPERSKHRKRTIGNLSAEPLKALNQSLFSILANYSKHKNWQMFHLDVQ